MNVSAIKSLRALALFFAGVSSATAYAGSDGDCQFRRLTDKVHVIIGSDHATCPAKEVEHPLTNISVITGDTGVIVIDPGSSLQAGRLLLRNLRRVTDKPVVAVFNTHIHGLYWLGNQAVREQYPNAKIYAHRRMIERIEDGEGAFWVKAITGKYAGERTSYVVPDAPLGGGEVLNIAGITLVIHHTGHAHTDHDIMIEVPEERTLFLGGIVVEPEVPSQGVPQDADFKGQIAATRYAAGLGVERHVPGRGFVGGAELPERALRFLEALYEGVAQYYEDDLSDFEISNRMRSDLADFTRWYDFSELGGVISQMYLQIEQESF